ncbi:MAG: 3-hydroxyacyl-CoA dehydrogenase NAD-binding domain-containing protein [Planctomycetota bacterium]
MADASTLTLGYPEPGIAAIAIDNPHKGANVLSQSVLADLESKLDKVDAKAAVDGLDGLVIYSAEPRNFIAGADLREFVAKLEQPSENADRDEVALARRGQKLFGRLSTCPYVTVAAIHGSCMGGGSELAVWCDRRVMAREGVKFAFPEVKLGIYPGWGGTARTPRIVGLGNAVELVTGGEPVDAQAAAAMGLADDVADQEDLVDAAIRLIHAEKTLPQYLCDREKRKGPVRISDTELAFLGATASAYIQGQTKGHYPAPLVALELMLGAAGVDLAAACEMEAEGFGGVFGTPVNRALLNVFFLQDRNKKQAPRPKPEELRHTVGVVGAGVMGQGIAAASAKRGVAVVIGDASPEAAARGVQGVVTEASYNKKTKGPDAQKAIELAAAVRPADTGDDYAAADIVVEAVFEDADAKRAVYAEIEPRLQPGALLCTNTSTIPVTELARDLARPEDFCGLHFFNPVRRMPLVEVIRGEKTSDATVAAAQAYARQIGKSPIVVADGPGFLVNRVLMPYMNEALLLVQEGASLKKVDRVAEAFGMPMGPITLYDTVGLDVAVHAGGVMRAAFPNRVAGAELLPAMVEAGRFGQKNGRGFFDHTPDKRGKLKAKPSDEAQGIVERFQTADQPTGDLTDRLLMPMLLEATRIIEDGIVEDVRDVDLGLIYGIGFPPHKGGLFFWADTIGAGEILKKLEPLAKLGARYQPTELLKQVAASNGKFYDLS